MSKALTVLAECVDNRSGKRFTRGDEFSPAPTHEQAKRLIAAGCLPEEALKAAAGPKTEAERALEEKAARDREESARTKAAVEAAKAKTAERLSAAKAKAKGPLDPAVAQTTQVGDELFELTDDELAAVVEAEDVKVEDGADKPAIIAAIRAKRAEQ